MSGQTDIVWTGKLGSEQGMSKHGMFKTDLSSSKAPGAGGGRWARTDHAGAWCCARELGLYPQGKEERLQGLKQSENDQVCMSGGRGGEG